MALTVVTQHDIVRLQTIEEHVGVKMKEFEASEEEAVAAEAVFSSGLFNDESPRCSHI